MKKTSTILTALVLALILLCSCGGNAAVNPGEQASPVLSPSASSNVVSSESPAASPSSPTPDVGVQDALLTFCAMSDVHMGAQNTEETFTRAMKFFSKQKNKPEAYLFVGDLTDTTGSTGNGTQVTQFKNIYEQYAEPSQMFYCLGPTHDIPASASAQNCRELFSIKLGSSYFAQDLQSATVYATHGIRHKTVNGFHFFSIDWEGTTGGQLPVAGRNWLKEQLDALTKEDPNKPIFVITHAPDMSATTSVLRKYPQVVCFTGHIHNSFAREDAISQDYKFTQVHCGGMNYYRVTAYDRFYDNPYLNLGNIYDFGQALYVQVDADYNVTITRMDVYNGKVLNNPWVVGPTRRDVYTKERIKTAEKCMFLEDDKLDIQEIGEKQLVVSWDACKSGGAGSPLYYQVQLLKPNAQGVYQVIDHKELSSQQVFYPNDEGIPSLHYSYTFNGVDLSNYAVVVTAKDCWNVSGNALVYTNGTYVSEIPKGGTVQHTKRELSESEKLTGPVTPGAQKVTFPYKMSGDPSRFTDGYSMAVRFHPTYEFKDISIRCSSWGDLIGTLEFELYRWDQDYETTLSGTAIDTYTLSGYKGSTVYNVFDSTYDAGEYLVLITCPKPSEGVGVYHYALNSGSQKGSISYENGKQMATSIYLEWTNTATCTNPFVAYGVSN